MLKNKFLCIFYNVYVKNKKNTHKGVFFYNLIQNGYSLAHPGFCLNVAPLLS